MGWYPYLGVVERPWHPPNERDQALLLWMERRADAMNGDSETWQVALVMGAVVVVLIVLSVNAQ